MFENLTEDNFLLYAMKFYDNPQCMDVEEFNDDLKRIRYIKRLFKKYRETGELKERLVLNHLVVLYNMWEPTAITRMLLLRLDEYHNYLKPFLITLGYWPTKFGHIEGKRIIDSSIPLDDGIVAVLRKI